MINSEYLAISAIFFGGFYIGFKVKEGVYFIKDYLSKEKTKNNF